MRITLYLISLFNLFTINKLSAQSILDYKNYHEIFRDDFTYTEREELAKNWRFVNPNDPNQGWGDEYFAPEQVTLRSDGKHRRTGLLRLSAKRLAEAEAREHGNKLFASGKIESIVDMDGTPNCDGMYQGFTYGMFEIRCKLPYGHNGVWPTFWFLSSATEIDVIDNLKPDPDNVIQSNVIDWRKISPKDSSAHVASEAIFNKPYGPSLSAGFNTYTAVWTPTRVSFFFNGHHLYDVDDTAVATNRCAGMLLATLQMKNYDASVKKAHMDIDYIRVLKPNNNDYTVSYTKNVDNINNSLKAALPDVSPTAGAVAVNPMMPEEEVFYQGKDNELYRALRRGKRWQIESLHKLASLQQDDYLVQGNLTFDSRKGIITYQGRNNRKQLFYFDAGWHHAEVTSDNL
ncbi:glycoside hydrolase family 16 protein [Hymenobacter cavernae]|uniref:GH16 domain-containing protein n=1 Tax=Hymenobacter cavernae TaxID=2044852 RepID=A0ABQ1TMG7_9BACT|nr:family 16 glycosylhydrolase [Hymenobacter cavernae]GGE97847.1 hypothetical protein GCM10011383_05780 [Hymenobacter cavernae]